MRILFYVSGHGLGHATRMGAVMREVRAQDPEGTLFVRTAAPRWVFEFSSGGPVEYEAVRIDAGVVEQDLFRQNIPATLAAAAEVFAGKDTLVRREAAFVREAGIQLIVSDIPPLAAAVGHAAGVPVVAIGNFTWDFIFAPYVEKYPEYAWLLEEIRACYGHTHLFLRLPLSHETDVFPRQERIPLIARRPQASREEVRAELGMTDDPRKLVLVGGRMWDPDLLRRLDLLQSKEYRVLSLMGPEPGTGLFYPGDAWQQRFTDLLAASDLLVSKPGYGVVSECVACRTPLLYPPRYDFAEAEVFEREVTGMLRCRRISEEAFRSGNWLSHVAALIGEPAAWPETDVSGASVAAARLLSTLS